MILAQAGIAKQKQVHLYAFWMIAVLPLRIRKNWSRIKRLYRKTVLNSTDLQDRQDEFKYDFLQKCMRISKNHCNFYKNHIFLPFLPDFRTV